MSATADANLRAAGLVTATMALGALSDALVKLVLADLPIGQVMALRGGMICALLFALLLWRGRLAALYGALDRANLARAACEVAGAVCFFAALRHLPLGVAVVLLFTAPFFMTGVVALAGERVGAWRWGAVLAGFVGVVLVVPFEGGGGGAAYLLPLAAAALAALRDLLVRRVGRDADAVALGLAMALAVTLAGALSLPLGWRVLDGAALPLLAGSALCVAFAYVAIVAAYRMGEVSFLAPFRYGTIPFAILLGFVVFDERLEARTLLGALVIVVAGAVIFHRERRAARA